MTITVLLKMSFIILLLCVHSFDIFLLSIAVVLNLFQPASNIIVTQKPLTPKPSSCKSPLEGWSEDGKGNREPTETELISNLKDTTLHDDQVNGLEVQSHDGNGARENTVNSKENADEMQNNEDIKSSDKENGVVVKNGETGFIGGNAKNGRR